MKKNIYTYDIYNLYIYKYNKKNLQKNQFNSDFIFPRLFFLKMSI